MEAVWADGVEQPQYAPALGWPREDHPELRVCAGLQGATFLLSLQRALPKDIRMEVLLLPRYRVPLGQAGRYYAAFEAGLLVESHILRNGLQEEWTSPWKFAVFQGEDWSSELFIPYESVGGAPIAQGDQCWRVSIHIRDHGAEPDAAPIAAWPLSASTGAEHGVLIWADIPSPRHVP
jgi:hypothetical protein